MFSNNTLGLFNNCINKIPFEHQMSNSIFLVKGINNSNQIEHASVQVCLIILTSLKFCSNLGYLYAELNLNEFF